MYAQKTKSRLKLNTSKCPLYKHKIYYPISYSGGSTPSNKGGGEEGGAVIQTLR